MFWMRSGCGTPSPTTRSLCPPGWPSVSRTPRTPIWRTSRWRRTHGATSPWTTSEDEEGCGDAPCDLLPPRWPSSGATRIRFMEYDSDKPATAGWMDSRTSGPRRLHLFPL